MTTRQPPFPFQSHSLLTVGAMSKVRGFDRDETTIITYHPTVNIAGIRRLHKMDREKRWLVVNFDGRVIYSEESSGTQPK